MCSIRYVWSSTGSPLTPVSVTSASVSMFLGLIARRVCGTWLSRWDAVPVGIALVFADDRPLDVVDLRSAIVINS